MLAISVILGLILGGVAYIKGYSLLFWWLYGSVIFIVPSFIFSPIAGFILFIVVFVILLSKKPFGAKKCPKCAELVKEEAVKCKHCGSELEHPSEGK
ncbi:zinc ribbon domain-containing protein [Pectobacterium aroidearum]|uniref:zinc ribbon domain-containing protein n=1 Tax=Pectobacterium aroidearum TaxID=1201031 RepID=UPI003015E822